MPSKVPPPLLKTEMTPFPYHVDASATLDEAAAMMREHAIHHLPVMDRHRLTGIIAERDVNRVMAQNDTRPTAGEMVTNDPYVVDLHAPLATVAAEMAQRGDDAAVVARDGKVVGIFTATDACRVLASLLDECFPRPDDGVA